MVKNNLFTSATLDKFIKEHNKNLDTKSAIDEKVKLCSSDDFTNVANQLTDNMDLSKSNVFLSQVGGFYVTASLVGANAYNCDKGKEPKLLFFDRKDANIKNAMFNTLLMKACDTKEEYIKTLFSLSNTDIVKALDPKLYVSFIKDFWEEKNGDQKVTKEGLKVFYEEFKDQIDPIVEEDYITEDLIKEMLNDKFDLKKLTKYLKNKRYDSKAHFDNMTLKAEDKLSRSAYTLFKKLSLNMTKYLKEEDHYNDLIKYLSEDMKINKENHILTNDSIYEGYRSLINKNGTGSVKFIPGIDISNEKGVNELKNILEEENLLNNDKDSFPIDYIFVPHIHLLKPSHQFIKENVQEYIMLDKNRNKNNFVLNSTATINIRTYKEIGAEFIEEERNSRMPLENLSNIEAKKGFPLMSFMAGANIGNIYYSEVDTKNMIDMAIHDKVDTVYIQGLIYSTYFHNQTSRRLLVDPKYETLDSRLKEAKKLIKRLNDNGIKVVYQMGDEENHLYDDLYKMYVREQGVRGNNFLARDDLRTKFDWVRPIIKKELIPYLIRSGEDVTNIATDEVKESKVSDICHALKLYKEGLPLGNLAKYINPDYLKDTDMFRVVHSALDNYDINDEALTVNLLSNPNFSSITQYAKAASGVVKNLKLYQTNAIDTYSLEKIPQLFVDGRQGFMSLSYQGDQSTLNVPQMIKDEYYVNHPELLAGIKEGILEDPTHKRVTQLGTRPNVPGGWTITGDSREIMTVVPYYKRVKEVMEYVQKTGIALPELVVGHINDTQLGSPTERVAYMLKFWDYLIYERNAKGIWGNGDFQQGWNYPKFSNESRHLGSMSVSQQMVDFVELQRPFMRDAMGVVNNNLFVNETSIDEHHSREIVNNLIDNNLLDGNKGIYKNTNLIKKDIDYKTVDLKLPGIYKPYEKEIREKLCSIRQLWFYHLVEGNHEYNTDWNNKGYKLVEHIRQEMENLKDVTGNDLEIKLNEYFVNSDGDIVNAPYGSKTINGYNIVYGHQFRAPGKGSGGSPTVAMANYFDQMGPSSYRVDRAFMGHLHIFETSVINNKLLSITGSSAGQSGYEQMLGYSSRPLYVVDRYLSDGRIAVDTIGTEFLDNYQIQNPIIKEKGLDNFINECFTEEANVYGPDMPKKVNTLKPRTLRPGTTNKVIGPNIK